MHKNIHMVDIALLYHLTAQLRDEHQAAALWYLFWIGFTSISTGTTCTQYQASTCIDASLVSEEGLSLDGFSTKLTSQIN